MTAAFDPASLSAKSMDATRERLSAAIEAAAAFAAPRKLGFDQCFADGLAKLDSTDPLADFYHADMVPPGLLDLPARQVIGCCSAAWVFGGMGSWNDVWFDGDDGVEYERISDELFDAINAGLLLAANASFP